MVNGYKNQFDSIRICLYWRDIEFNRHKLYIEKGFECVCAGSLCDSNFMSRLKGLLNICDATITNAIGSHVGYSISLNKPVMMISKVHLDTSDLNPNGLRYFSNDALPNEYKILEEMLLDNKNLEINDEIRKTIEFFAGLQEKKTQEELRRIFFEAEQLFQQSPYRHHFLKFR
jgi:hypothetical protein